MHYATSAPSPANDLFIKPQLRCILFYKNSKLSTPTEIFPRKISKPLPHKTKIFIRRRIGRGLARGCRAERGR